MCSMARPTGNLNGADDLSAARLRAIADELRRLSPSRTDPHAYFEQKSELEHELRTLALGLDQVGPRAPRSIPLRTPNSTIVELPNPKCATVAYSAHCRHCLRRRAQQTRRHRLRLRNVDLFEWAARQ